MKILRLTCSYYSQELRRDGGVTDICGSMGSGIGMQNESSTPNELETTKSCNTWCLFKSDCLRRPSRNDWGDRPIRPKPGSGKA